MEPTTQAPNTEVKADNTPSVSEGVQKRIDELVAKNGELERQYNEVKLKYENTASAVAASLGVQTQPVKPNVDPSLQEAINAALAPVIAEMRQTVGGLRMSESQRALQEAYQRNAVPDTVKKKAQEIYDEYAKKGVILKEDVVVNQAWGIVAREEHLKSVAANTSRQGFNQPYANYGGGGNGLPMASVNTVEKPANFDSLPIGEQVAWYQKNVGDKPL